MLISPCVHSAKVNMTNIIRIDTQQGRFYETPSGKFPSVNTILVESMPPEDKARLEKWRRKHQKYFLEKEGGISAAERGTLMHEAVANYFQDRSLTNPELHPTVEPFWKSIKPWLIKAGAIRYSETYTYRGIEYISKVNHTGLSSHFNPLEMITYRPSK